MNDPTCEPFSEHDDRSPYTAAMESSFRIVPLVAAGLLLIGLALVLGPGTSSMGYPLIGLAVLAWLLLAWRAIAARSGDTGMNDDELIELVDGERRAELIRGTSFQLRNLRYRYSIRVDRNEPQDQKCFTEIINTVRLGFVPVVITDNDTDRQGYGYVAFVHDGKRWRGPGLPCPAGREAAIAHAQRCVSPLDPPSGNDDSDNTAAERSAGSGGG